MSYYNNNFKSHKFVRIWRILRKKIFTLTICRRFKIYNLAILILGVLHLNFCQWLKLLCDNIHNVNSILFTDEADFSKDEINNMRNNHQWSYENAHGTVKISFQYWFYINVWCVLIDEYILPFIFESRLTGIVYLNFLKNLNHLPTFLEEISLQSR